MKEFLLSILKGLADYPDEIKIEDSLNLEANEYHFKIDCNRSDIGKFIGKQGKHAEAIRTICMAAAGRERKKIYLEFPK